MVRRCVRSRNLVNEEALAHWGAVAPKNKQTNLPVNLTTSNLTNCSRVLIEKLTIAQHANKFQVNQYTKISISPKTTKFFECYTPTNALST